MWILLLTGLACWCVFVLVAAWSVGLTRLEKTGMCAMLAGALLCGTSGYFLNRSLEARLPAARWTIVLGFVGFGLGIAGFALVLFVGTLHMWRERKRVLPFLYGCDGRAAASASQQSQPQKDLETGD